MSTYVTAAQVRQVAQIHSSTLRNWSEAGILDCIRLPGGKRLYNKQQLELKLFGSTAKERPKTKVVYARVSSQHQKADLERQIQDLQEAYPEHEVLKDIASGLNWKRPGLCSLLERCYEGSIEEVVVAYRDRLCRFGLELLEWIFKKHKVRFVVHNKVETPPNPSTELAEDLLAVSNFFVAKNNGKRAAEKRLVLLLSFIPISKSYFEFYRRERKAKKQRKEEGCQDQPTVQHPNSVPGPSSPVPETTTSTTTEVVRSV